MEKIIHTYYWYTTGWWFCGIHAQNKLECQSLNSRWKVWIFAILGVWVDCRLCSTWGLEISRIGYTYDAGYFSWFPPSHSQKITLWKIVIYLGIDFDGYKVKINRTSKFKQPSKSMDFYYISGCMLKHRLRSTQTKNISNRV